MQLERRPGRARLTRSLLSLLAFWALAPVVFFIPPHLPWVLISLGCGLYFGYKQWSGVYVVHSFSGPCPRCEAILSIPPGTLIRLPHRMDCYRCHHQPTLVVGDPGG